MKFKSFTINIAADLPPNYEALVASVYICFELWFYSHERRTLCKWLSNVRHKARLQQTEQLWKQQDKSTHVKSLPLSSISWRIRAINWSVMTFSSYIPSTWDNKVFKVWHSFSSNDAKDWTSDNRTAVSLGTPSCRRSCNTPSKARHHKKPSLLERVRTSKIRASPHWFSFICCRRRLLEWFRLRRTLAIVWSQLFPNATNSFREKKQTNKQKQKMHKTG